MAVSLRVIVVLPLVSSIVWCVSDDVYSYLPKLYELDNAESCRNNNGVFCKLIVTLSQNRESNDTKASNIIKETLKDNRYFRHDRLFHGRCFKRQQIRRLDKILREEYKSKYENWSLVGDVQKVTCFEEARSLLDDIDYWDLLSMSVGVIYAMFLALATGYTYFAEHEKDNVFAKLLSIFSLVTIWRELRKPIKSEDFQNLKSIQGIRTLTMMLIISLHAFYGNMLSYLRNPEFVENIYINLITRCMVTIFTFLVQSFFLISAWLLTVQVNNIIRKNGNLTFKDVFLLGFNRYFRLIPPVVVLILALRTNIAYHLVSYTNEDIMKREVDICRYYWWKNFFFIQNIYEPDKICSAVTWYIATDYQLYLLTLGLFYISHKAKLDRTYLIGLVVITTIATQVAVITHTDFQGFLRLIPKTANLEDMLVSDAFTLSYVPVWCNSITYMMGIVFGTIYCKHKGEKIFHDNVRKLLWFIGFFGLPVLAIFIASFQYEFRIFEIAISILTRPLFALGIGIGIFGMACKTGGMIRMVLESELLVFLANFCYCVYLCHYAFVFLRILMVDEMVELSAMYILKYTAIDYTLSFLFGAFLYIVVEHPWIQLQKWVLPQVSTKKASSQESSKIPSVHTNGITC